MSIVVKPLEASTEITATRTWTDEKGGAPLRCCLRDSRAGERIVLGAVTPPGPFGAYAETGPVFLHADGCQGPVSPGYPEDFRGRQQVFRAYNGEGMIVGGALVDPGQGQEQVAERLLCAPDIAFLHSRNVVYGCYMFAIYPGDR